MAESTSELCRPLIGSPRLPRNGQCHSHLARRPLRPLLPINSQVHEGDPNEKPTSEPAPKLPTSKPAPKQPASKPGDPSASPAVAAVAAAAPGAWLADDVIELDSGGTSLTSSRKDSVPTRANACSSLHLITPKIIQQFLPGITGTSCLLTSNSVTIPREGDLAGTAVQGMESAIV